MRDETTSPRLDRVLGRLKDIRKGNECGNGSSRNMRRVDSQRNVQGWMGGKSGCMKESVAQISAIYQSLYQDFLEEGDFSLSDLDFFLKSPCEREASSPLPMFCFVEGWGAVIGRPFDLVVAAPDFGSGVVGREEKERSRESDPPIDLEDVPSVGCPLLVEGRVDVDANGGECVAVFPLVFPPLEDGRYIKDDGGVGGEERAGFGAESLANFLSEASCLASVNGVPAV